MYFRFHRWRNICSRAKVARRRRPAEAQCKRILGLGYKLCAAIPVAGRRTHGTTFRALKVTSQVATPGAESAVLDCLVWFCSDHLCLARVLQSWWQWMPLNRQMGVGLWPMICTLVDQLTARRLPLATATRLNDRMSRDWQPTTLADTKTSRQRCPVAHSHCIWQRNYISVNCRMFWNETGYKFRLNYVHWRHYWRPRLIFNNASWNFQWTHVINTAKCRAL